MNKTEEKDELTQEEAVRLAEWLGLELTTRGSWGYPIGINSLETVADDNECLKLWLNEAEGERALQDKCEQLEWDIGNDKCKAGRTITLEPIDAYPLIAYVETAPTRIRALQRAILSAIGGK